jgi:pyrroloquinoline quinone biosynthesis protein D
MTAALSESTQPRLARGVRLRQDKARGGHVLLAPERVLQANGTAVEVLALCDGERTLGEIVDLLAGRFATDRERIASEVDALLRDLAAKRMVEL